MSSRKGQLGAVNKDLAAQTKLQEQLSTILNCKEHFSKVCEDPALLTFQSEVIGLLNAMKLFVDLDTGLRENFTDGQRSSTLHEIVVFKYRRLDAKASQLTLKFQKECGILNDLQDKWMKEPVWDYAAFSRMTAKLIDGVVEKLQDRKRATIEWRVNFEVLRGEWNGEKEELLAQLHQCIQILRDLRVGLESNPEYNEKPEKGQPKKKE